MLAEQRNPAICNFSDKMEGKVDMIKSTISLQDLRRGIYIKAKAELAWRSWQRKGFGWKKWSNQWIY